MQHLYDFLHSKKLDIRQILSCRCVITEKLDGSAFQYYNDNGNIVYGKRGSSSNKMSTNHIDEFDLLLTPMYNNAYNIINNAKIDDDIQILNFEIFDKVNKHIVKYGEFKNDIVLLSGYNKNGTILPESRLVDIAKKLNIEYNNIIWSGYLDIELILNNKDSDVDLWNIICSITRVYGDIEGFVLTFIDDDNNVKRILKSQNPEFQLKIMVHLKNEQVNKQHIDLEYVYNLFISQYSTMSKEQTPIQRLLELYFACEVSTNDYTELEKTLDELGILSNQEINITQGKQYYLFPDNISDIMYPNILKFILLVFRSKRTKYPLWCSLDFQKNVVNPFLDTYIFN